MRARPPYRLSQERFLAGFIGEKLTGCGARNYVNLCAQIVPDFSIALWGCQAETSVAEPPPAASFRRHTSTPMVSPLVSPAVSPAGGQAPWTEAG